MGKRIGLKKVIKGESTVVLPKKKEKEW